MINRVSARRESAHRAVANAADTWSITKTLESILPQVVN